MPVHFGLDDLATLTLLPLLLVDHGHVHDRNARHVLWLQAIELVRRLLDHSFTVDLNN